MTGANRTFGRAPIAPALGMLEPGAKTAGSKRDIEIPAHNGAPRLHARAWLHRRPGCSKRVTWFSPPTFLPLPRSPPTVFGRVKLPSRGRVYLAPYITVYIHLAARVKSPSRGRVYLAPYIIGRVYLCIRPAIGICNKLGEAITGEARGENG